MAIFSRKHFERLAGMQSTDSATFYIPTYRDGDNERAKIRFKNQIRAIKKQLESFGRGQKYIDEYLKSLNKKLDDPIFWRHLSDGLIVFHNMEVHEVYSLPVHFDELYYLGNTFYLTPTMPYFNGFGRFYLLALSLKQTRLYEGSRDDFARINMEDILPERLEDSVGYDYEQKNLQFRTENTTAREAQFHGHGSGKDDKDSEVMRFLRDINKGFTDLAGKNGKPLVVAAIDDLFFKYKSINSYQNLHPENISGNPDETDAIILHEKAWDQVKEEFLRFREKAFEDFKKNQSNNKTAVDIRTVVPESHAGNVETLFIENGKDVWGSYDEQSLEVKVDEESQPENGSLTDRACKDTFLQGGQVYLVNREDMPVDGSAVCALLRYKK